MKNLHFILIFLFFASCGTSQNSGLEIIKSLPNEEQHRILQQIQPPSSFQHLKKLPFDGKSNFDGIDYLSKNIKSVKTINRNYRITKEDWPVDDFAKKENHGTITELFFDKKQKVIKAMEYQAENGVTAEEIFEVNYYGGDKVISRGRRKGKISYQYNDNVVSVTDKSIYNTTEIETFIKSNDSITSYYQYLPKPKVLKYEYLFNKNNLLSNFKHYHGGGVNSMEYLYNKEGQIIKYIQTGDHHLLDKPKKSTWILELTYYDFGGIKETISQDEINNKTTSNTTYYSFRKDKNENLIIKINSQSSNSEFHLDKHNNIIYCCKKLENVNQTIAYTRVIEYY